MPLQISIPTPTVSAMTLSGAKTYIVAAASVAYALYGYYEHQLDAPTAAAFLLSGAGGAAIRAAIAKASAFLVAHAAALAEVKALLQAVLAQTSATATAVQLGAPIITPRTES